MKVLGEKNQEKQQNRKSARTLRFALKNVKQEMLTMKTSFVLQKMNFKKKISSLKKEIIELKDCLKNFMCDDNDFVVDPVTGVIDMTQPKTPKKPQKPKRKRKRPVSLMGCKKKLNM